jgi:hypothetical protein
MHKSLTHSRISKVPILTCLICLCVFVRACLRDSYLGDPCKYTAVDVPLISVENAMPIRDDLQEAMSYVIARCERTSFFAMPIYTPQKRKLCRDRLGTNIREVETSGVLCRSIAANEYGQLSQMQRNTRGIIDRDSCVGIAQSEDDNSESKLDAATMMAPFLICFLFTTGGLIMRWGVDLIKFSAQAGAGFGIGFVILFVLGVAVTAAWEVLSVGEELLGEDGVIMEVIGNAFFLGIIGGVIGLISAVKKLAEAASAVVATPLADATAARAAELQSQNALVKRSNPAREEKDGDEED